MVSSYAACGVLAAALVLTSAAAGAQEASVDPATTAATEQSASLSAASQTAAPVTTVQVDPAVAAQPAPAPVPSAPDLSAGTELLITSAYVWRGFVPTNVVSYQPTSWAKYRNVSVSSWFNLAGDQSVGPLTEHDLTVDWSVSRSDWTFSAGWINYVFPGAAVDQVSNELYAGAAYAGPLNPGVKVYQDVHAGSGTYINLGVSQAVEFPHGISLTPAFSIGYNHEQWIDSSTWSDATTSARLSFPLPIERLWLSSFIAYTKGLDEELFPDTFWGGVAITVR